MAQSKQNSNLLSIIVILIYGLLPVVYVKSLVDNTLVPHQLFASIGLIVLGVLMFTARGRYKIKLGGMVLSMLGFVIINIIAVSGSINPVEGWATVSRYGLSLGMLITLITLFQWQKLKATDLIKGVVIFGSIAGIVTLFELLKALGSGDFISDIYVVSGTFSHKNLLSSGLMLSLPFAIMGAAVLSSAWKRWSILLVFLLIAEIFVLRTRGVWLGVFVSAFTFILLFFAMRKKSSLEVKFPMKKVGIAAVLAALLLVGLFSASQVSDDVSNTTNLENRLVFWNNSVEMIKENPMLGVGPGNWKINFPKYGLMGLENSVLQGITQVQRPHNDYLWVLTEGGPLALIFFIGIFVFALLRLGKNFKQPLTTHDLAIDMAAGFGLLAYLVFSLTDFPLERSSHQLLLVALLAIVFRNGLDKEKLKPEIKSTVVLSVVIALAVFSTVVSGNRWSGEQASVKVLEANRTRNAQRIIKTSDEALNRFYNMDNFANPIRYYSALGKLVLDNYEGAMQDAQEAYDLAPYNVVVINQLGNVYRSMDDVEKALEIYGRATEISPAMESARLSSAELYLNKGDYVAAFDEVRFMLRNTKNPRYDRVLKAILPPLVTNQKQHGRFEKLATYMRQQNPQSADEMVRLYKVQLKESN